MSPLLLIFVSIVGCFFSCRYLLNSKSYVNSFRADILVLASYLLLILPRYWANSFELTPSLLGSATQQSLDQVYVIITMSVIFFQLAYKFFSFKLRSVFPSTCQIEILKQENSSGIKLFLLIETVLLVAAITFTGIDTIREFNFADKLSLYGDSLPLVNLFFFFKPTLGLLAAILIFLNTFNRLFTVSSFALSISMAWFLFVALGRRLNIAEAIIILTANWVASKNLNNAISSNVLNKINGKYIITICIFTPLILIASFLVLFQRLLFQGNIAAVDFSIYTAFTYPLLDVAADVYQNISSPQLNINFNEFYLIIPGSVRTLLSAPIIDQFEVRSDRINFFEMFPGTISMDTVTGLPGTIFADCFRNFDNISIIFIILIAPFLIALCEKILVILFKDFSNSFKLFVVAPLFLAFIFSFLKDGSLIPNLLYFIKDLITLAIAWSILKPFASLWGFKK